MASASSVLDEVVKEYLLYRGFTNTLKAFETEKKDDKDKGYKVSLSFLTPLVQNQIIIKEYIIYFSTCFWCRLIGLWIIF